MKKCTQVCVCGALAVQQVSPQCAKGKGKISLHKLCFECQTEISLLGIAVFSKDQQCFSKGLPIL